MRFGDFEWLCRNAPSLPTCNLLHNQILAESSSGDGPSCSVNQPNIPNIVLCGVSVPLVGALIWATWRRKAAVGRIEFALLLAMNLSTLPFQLITATGILAQGSAALYILTAVYIGLFVSFFCVLLANGIVITQFVEDGTMAALVPTSFLAFAGFVLPLYIGLDTAFGWTDTFAGSSAHLHNLSLFILTLIVPLAFSCIWLGVTLFVVLVHLRETKPAVLFVCAWLLGIAGAALVYFLASMPLCKASDGKVDGSFLATFLSTTSIFLLFLSHVRITESSWGDDGSDDNLY